MRAPATRAGLAFVALLAVCVPVAGAAKDETILVSRASDAAGGAAGDFGSGSASISADGRFVAFGSDAKNLSDADSDTHFEVFVRDLQAGTTEFVGKGPVAGASYHPSISGDGRFVAFDTPADFGDGGVNNVTDVYLRDRQTNTLSLISKTTAGVGGSDTSDEPAISADGRYVAFESTASNLSTEDNNSFFSIYVRDTQAGTTTLVSRATGAAGPVANGTSFEPAISADGRWVAYRSNATNLGDDVDATYDVFVRDTQTNTTFLVSRQSDAAGGASADADAFAPTVSGDGQRIAFRSGADNLVSDDDNAAVYSVFVRDLQAGTTSLVSRQSTTDGGAPSNERSGTPSISADGRYVAFNSDSDNLFPGTEDDAFDQEFVRDLLTGTTTLVSRQSAADGGAPGDTQSSGPSISGDGRYVAFSSAANNLSSVDVDGASSDVFVRDVLGPPVVITPDATGPVLDVVVKGKQKLGKPITLTVTSDEAAELAAGGTAKPKGQARGHGRAGKPLQLGSDDASAMANTAVTLKLKPAKRVKRKLKKAAKAKAAVVLTATDAAGNPTTQTLKIKLR